MVGGFDVVLDAHGLGDEACLYAGARAVLKEWPLAVLQDGASGRMFAGLWEMPFGVLRDLLIYRDDESFRSWEDRGATNENANALVNLIAKADKLTLVVGDPEEGSMRRIISGAVGLLDSSLSRVCAEAA
jgi:hypothetical protein